ncbi:hypothetical protein TSAR_010727 [Trichomalopsis sarcophagae]|uniref:Uncharacterized protein n=1 Tax=Trichomalopsis sarcophagae TaxID=543379 RepID=A0A232ENP6_9HYME|nr:hypothetical protein TSAR_010727 [Trichomalopsis sarcophagae]
MLREEPLSHVHIYALPAQSRQRSAFLSMKEKDKGVGEDRELIFYLEREIIPRITFRERYARCILSIRTISW